MILGFDFLTQNAVDVQYCLVSTVYIGKAV